MPENQAAGLRRDHGLVRAMGTWVLAAGIVNVTIGGGIFRLPAGAAAALGPSAAYAYIACAVVMALVVVCFAEAGSRVAATGGLYAYVEVAFGPFIGFLVGAMLWASMTAALAAVTTFFGDSLAALVPALGAPVPRAIAVVAILGGLALLNVRGVREASRFNALMTAAKLTPLLLFILVGLFAVQGDHYAGAARIPAPSQLASASSLLIFAFLGLEAALMPSGEVMDPARTVPRAVFAAIGAVTVIYLAIHLVSQGVLGSALAASPTPVADAAGGAVGAWGRTLILIGSMISMFGYVSGMTLAVPRSLMAFARDGFLPSALGAVHERYRTPYVAILVQAGIAIALALSGAFEQLALLANGVGLIAYAACCAASWQLRRRDVRQAGGEPYRAPGGGIAPLLALLAIGWLLTGLELREWLSVGAALLVALVVYVSSRRSRARG